MVTGRVKKAVRYSKTLLLLRVLPLGSLLPERLCSNGSNHVLNFVIFLVIRVRLLTRRFDHPEILISSVVTSPAIPHFMCRSLLAVHALEKRNVSWFDFRYKIKSNFGHFCHQGWNIIDENALETMKHQVAVQSPRTHLETPKGSAECKNAPWNIIDENALKIISPVLLAWSPKWG